MASFSDASLVTRDRAFTWHGRQTQILDEGAHTLHKASPKKPWSRRNAWGDMSYADLISRAIESSPDKRLTLAQIYDWMVQNVPYFRDKGNTNSSAGWKNSIRHNLSLHRRFRRVMNDDTGKSSWWVINDGAAINNHIGSSGSSSSSCWQLHTVPNRDVPRRSRSHQDVEIAACSERALTATPGVSPAVESYSETLTDGAFASSSGSCGSLFGFPSGAEMKTESAAVFAASDATGSRSSSADLVTQQRSSMAWMPCDSGNTATTAAIISSSSNNNDDNHASTIGHDCSSLPDFDNSQSSYLLPLMPISEIFGPVEGSSTNLVELQSASVLDDPPFQMLPAEDLSRLLDADGCQLGSWYLPPVPYTGEQAQQQDGSAPSAPPLVKTSINANGRTMQCGNHANGSSLLRQMLAQTHHENAVMHGLADKYGLPPFVGFTEAWQLVQPEADLIHYAVEVPDGSIAAMSDPSKIGMGTGNGNVDHSSIASSSSSSSNDTAVRPYIAEKSVCVDVSRFGCKIEGAKHPLVLQGFSYIEGDIVGGRDGCFIVNNNNNNNNSININGDGLHSKKLTTCDIGFVGKV